MSTDSNRVNLTAIESGEVELREYTILDLSGPTSFEVKGSALHITIEEMNTPCACTAISRASVTLPREELAVLFEFLREHY